LTRFVSTTPDSSLLPFPWDVPLEAWPAELLVALPRGLSRHVVRFIQVGDHVYAAKEVIEHLAEREYRLLQDLRRLGTPAVEPMGVVTERRDSDGRPLDPILLTRHLEFSLPYRSLFSPGVRQETVLRLVDAMVVLIARLHLCGFKWGDISLSNILFRRDAGHFAAYLVDAETGELHEALSDGQREQDLEIARVNLFGDFLDLAAAGRLQEPLDPLALTTTILDRYRELWRELTGAEQFAGSEHKRIERRVRRLNALGFDVAEMDIRTDTGASVIRIQPMVVDAGHHQRRLMRLTGLDTEENQARRLLNDLDTYRLSTGQSAVAEAVVAHRWLTEVFEPVMELVPEGLRAKREPAQLFHELLDYRWYQGERENRDVPILEAAAGYVRDVLQALPDEALGELEEPEEAESIPYDPWEASFETEPAVGPYLDIDALRAKQG